MSQEITEELLLFFHSFLTGIIMAVFYDGLLIIRRVIRHGQFWISLEDFFFWLICAWGAFLFLVEENNGILRWFAVGGAILGAFLYKKTVSKYYINIMSTIGKSILHILYLVVQKIMTPINPGTMHGYILSFFLICITHLNKLKVHCLWHPLYPQGSHHPQGSQTYCPLSYF